MPVVVDLDDELLAWACGVTVEQLTELPDWVLVFASELLTSP